MMQAMIFAAGLGTRLKPLTEKIPKALVRVGDKTLLERVINKLKGAGTDKIVVNVHHFSNQIIDYLRRNDNFGVEILISDESDKLLDTGGGIKKASSLLSKTSPVLIHNVDILSNVNLKSFYESNLNNDATLLVSKRKTKRYLLFDSDMRLVGWTNIETGEVKSPYTDLQPSKYKKYAFSGIHLFSPKLFGYMNDFPDKFGIIDFYLDICAKANIKGYLKEDLKLMDVGKMETLSQAEEFINNQI
ncbi:nucleotidyltransferase family protein [Xylanibacter oryzae]|uniref:nucleotidyltransferase family protein n=1 Tax=Xylanibacter oryzae TaxID=185293 RepID=UPI00056672E7|nr:nucleotidyltransferase family protein [Xylanibacter oryzae]